MKKKKKNENPMNCSWEYKLVQPLWKTEWSILKKRKIELPYASVIPFLDIDLKETKSLAQRDTCTPMFVALLCTITKPWK